MEKWTQPEGDLPQELEELLCAYAEGVFPMGGYEDGQLRWFRPEKRGLIPLDERFHVPHGMRRWLKKQGEALLYDIRINTAFSEVIEACSRRAEWGKDSGLSPEELWIDDKIKALYQGLHDWGFAYSFEIWDEEGLQGGLYGVILGRAFFGESMFSRKSNTSKLALLALVSFLRRNDFILLDTQWATEHLKGFGAYEVSPEEYQKELQRALGDIFV